MSQMLVKMILELVDRMSAPLQTVTSEVQKLEKATAAATGAGLATSHVDAWRQHTDAIRKAREEGEKYTAVMGKIATVAGAAAVGGAVVSGWAKKVDELMKTPIERARALEAQAEELARAAGLHNQRTSLQQSALAMQRTSGLGFEDILRGRRKYVEMGGGDQLMSILPHEARLARLAKAGGIELQHLYSALHSYINTAKLGPEAAITALETNYIQGKRGAYELQHLAGTIASLLPMGRTFGQTGQQAATNLPALLQLFRTVSGSTGVADTLARSMLKQLTAPAYIKRINSELGIDVNAEREAARASGRDPLLHVLNLLAGALQRGGPDAHGKVQGDEIVGGDPAKMGSIFRELNVRRAIEAFIAKRDMLPGLTPDAAEATRVVVADYASVMSTGAEAARRLANEQDLLAIRLGQSRLEDEAREERKKAGRYQRVTDFAERSQGPVGVALEGVEWLGKLGTVATWVTAAVASIASYSWIKGSLPKWFGGGGAGGAAGVPGATPGAIGPGLPSAGGWAAAARGAAARGVVIGGITYAGEYAIDKAIGALPKPNYPAGYNPREELNLGIIGRFGRLLENLGVTKPAQPAAPQVDAKQIEAFKAEAQQAGKVFLEALGQTVKPIVDAGSIDGAITKMRELLGLIERVGPGLAQAQTQVQRGVQRSGAALHDGPETQ